MGFRREFVGVLVILAVILTELSSFGFGVSVDFDNPSGYGRRSQQVRIHSEHGSALVLPLEESKQKGAVMDRRFKERRRGLEYEAEWEDARMTLHDDLLTKGCDFSPNSMNSWIWLHCIGRRSIIHLQ